MCSHLKMLAISLDLISILVFQCGICGICLLIGINILLNCDVLTHENIGNIYWGCQYVLHQIDHVTSYRKLLINITAQKLISLIPNMLHFARGCH